jgi:hypothetical protein
MQQIFTAEDTWHGGFYELAMQFGPRADRMLESGLQTIWRLPFLEGTYLRNDIEPAQQQRADPSLERQIEAVHLHGIATLPNGRRVACGTVVVREDEGDDWLDFYVPSGSLGTAYPVGAYPFDEADSSREWREPLESWLADIGNAVFAAAPFRLGLVGFEVSGAERVEHLAHSGVPNERGIGFLMPSGKKLEWCPTNQWLPKHVS